MKRILASVGFAAIAVGAFAQVNNPSYNADGTLNKVAGIGIEQKLGSDVPMDLMLKDENGNSVRMSQYFGHRPILLNLIFYKCQGMCSLELTGLIDSFAKMADMKPGQKEGPAHDRIGKDLDVVTVSIDPNETPADAMNRKKQVMDNFPDKVYPTAPEGWHFLTADLPTLNKLVTSVGYQYVYNPKTKSINHPVGVMLLSPSGKVVKYFYGTAYPELPLHDAIAMAAKEQVGSKAEVYLLGCLCRDAATGKYSVNVEQTLKVLCVMTVLGLAFSIWRMGHSKKSVHGGGGDEQVHHG